MWGVNLWGCVRLWKISVWLQFIWEAAFGVKVTYFKSLTTNIWSQVLNFMPARAKSFCPALSPMKKYWNVLESRYGNSGHHHPAFPPDLAWLSQAVHPSSPADSNCNRIRNWGVLLNLVSALRSARVGRQDVMRAHRSRLINDSSSNLRLESLDSPDHSRFSAASGDRMLIDANRHYRWAVRVF